MIIDIPTGDRGRIYQKIADEFGVKVRAVSLLNNGRKKPTRIKDHEIINALLHEGELYNRKKASIIKNYESNIKRVDGCANGLHGAHSERDS